MASTEKIITLSDNTFAKGAVLIDPTTGLPYAASGGGGGGGGASLADTLLTDGTGTLFVARDNGATITYFNLNSGSAYTPSGTIVVADTLAVGVDATGVTAPTGGSGLRGWLSGIYNKLTGTLDVSASSLPLPTGAGTAANQAAIISALGTPLQAGGNVAVTALPYVGVIGATAPLDVGLAGFVDANGNAQPSTPSNPFPVEKTGSYFTKSTLNSSTAQLAAGATFTGTIEALPTALSLSLNIPSDQPLTVTVNGYEGPGAGTFIGSRVYSVVAGVGLNVVYEANPNYVNVVVQNIGTATTTTLVIDSQYGDIPAMTALGNAPGAINEIGGVAVPAGALPAILVGAPGGDFAGVNLLEQAMNDNSGLGLNVKLIAPVAKQDGQGAFVLSDAPAAIPMYGAVGESFIIDTTGYQSLNVTAETLAGTVTASDDGITWSALTGVPRVLGAYVTALTAGAGFIFPVIARYIKITLTTAGYGTAYLRSAPWPGAYTTSVPTAAPTVPAGTATNNVSQIGGTAVVTGGLAGTLAVGGNVAAGVAPTTNSLQVGGVDSGGLTRRLLTDTSGRAQAAMVGIDAAAVQRQAGQTFGQSSQAMPSLLTQESTLFEGQSQIDLLAQILLELRILNQQAYALPQFLNAGLVSTDEPASFRVDPSVFTPF